MTDEMLVVGVDGSPTSQAALEWTVEVAGQYGARVTAVRTWRWDVVVGVGLPVIPAAVATATRQAVDTQVEKALAGCAHGTASVAVEAVVREGDPAVELIDAANRASLLVLGRHGQGRWQRRLTGAHLGSVAGHCLSHATVPVAVVPAGAAGGVPSRVVVGVDGSSASRRALAWAAAHAQVVGAPVVAVMAWQLTSVPSPGFGEDWSVPPLPEWEAKAAASLDETVQAALDAEQAATVERRLLHEPAAAGILQSVRKDDLLVLGERGRGGFARLLLGSVSRQCVEHAPCPVVVVPPPDRELPAAAAWEPE